MNPKSTTRPPSKKAYAAPVLTRYGDVRKLVQTGTMTPNETMALMIPSRMVVSDRAAKANVARVGLHPLGIGLYLFDYRPEFRDACGHGRQFGVMADEVEKVMPQAVSIGPYGHKAVDYAMLGIRRPAS